MAAFDVTVSVVPSFAFRPRPIHFVLAVGFFLACVVGTAVLSGEGHDTFVWRVSHDIVQAVGAVALAVVGVGTVLEWRERRRWSSAVQFIAVDLFDQTIRQAGAITARAAYLLIGDSDTVREVDQAFRLPWTAASAEAVSGFKARLGSKALEAFADGGQFCDRALESKEELVARADRLEDATKELTLHLKSDSAVPLFQEVIVLHRLIRDLTDESPRLGAPPWLVAPLVATMSLQIFSQGIAVAGKLAPPFNQLRRDLKDPKMLESILRTEESLAEDEEFRREMAAADEWLKNWEDQTDKTLKEMNAALNEITEAVRRINDE